MRALPAIVLVLLGVVAWLVLRDPEQVAPAPPVASAAAEDDPASELPEPAVAPATKVEPKRTEVDGSEQKKKPSLLSRLFGGKKESPEESVEPEKIGVECSVIVVDANGLEHANESGTATMAFREPASNDVANARHRAAWFSMEEADVTEGRFHVEIRPECLLEVKALELGGRPAIAEGGPFEIAAGVPLTIRARWVEAARLRVIDAASRVPLSDVTVARSEGDYSRYGHGHPGLLVADAIVVEHGVSPVQVPPPLASSLQLHRGDWVESCWVGATGHAWAKVDVDFKSAAETVVELAAGATLVVEVQGELPLPRPSLRLRKRAEREDFEEMRKQALAQYDAAKPGDFPGGRKPSLAEFERMLEEYRTQFAAQFELGEVIAEFDATPGESRIDGLPVGDLSVSVETGDVYRNPLVAAEVAATLVAETMNRVTLTLAARAPAPEPVLLAGTIHVPSGWDRDELRLEIRPTTLRGATSEDDKDLKLREMTPIAVRPHWFRWSVGTVEPATYRISVKPTGFSRQVEVAPPAGADVEILLAEAATLTIRLIDDVTGKPVVLDPKMFGFAWLPERTDSIYDFDSMVQFETRGSRVSGTVPVGRGGLYLSEIDWTPVSDTTCDVRPGSQELVVRMRRACGITLSLACDGAPVSMEDLGEKDLEIEAIDHAGVTTAAIWTYEQRSTRVSAPGRYRITLAVRPGYEPVEPFEIDLPDGEHVTRVIELKKKR